MVHGHTHMPGRDLGGHVPPDQGVSWLAEKRSDVVDSWKCETACLVHCCVGNHGAEGVLVLSRASSEKTESDQPSL